MQQSKQTKRRSEDPCACIVVDAGAASLETLAKAWCQLPPDGVLLVGDWEEPCVHALAVMVQAPLHTFPDRDSSVGERVGAIVRGAT